MEARVEKKKLRSSKDPIVVFILVVSLILLISAITMLAQYRDEIVERTSSKAEYNTLAITTDVDTKIGKDIAKVSSLAEYMTDAVKNPVTSPTYPETADDISKAKITSYINSLKGSYNYRALLGVRFYKDNTIYSDSFEPLDLIKDKTTEYRKNNLYQAAYIGDDSLPFNNGSITAIVMYSPVNDVSYCDGVSLFFSYSILDDYFNASTYKEHNSEYSFLTDTDGNLIHDTYGIKDNLSSFLQTNVNNSTDAALCMSMVSNKESSSKVINFKGKECLFTVGYRNNLSNLRIVEIYQTEKLYDTSFNFIRTIVVILILFAIVDVSYIIFNAFKSAKIKKQLLRLETKDGLLECDNRLGFEQQADKIISHNPNSHFYVVIAEIRHIKYLKEQFGEVEVNNLLVFFNTIIKGTMRIEETYGHIQTGVFALLLRENTKEDLIKRLKSNSYIFNQYKSTEKFDISLSYGVYGVDNQEHINASKIIDYARETINENATPNLAVANASYYFYSEELRKIRMQNENIELRMDTALQNGEFQVFFQPKYNLNKNVQDGAEALVRWYDAKSNIYNPPAAFLSLFESNGFIVKLDRYVFRKVCEHISYSIASGRKVFPVSVNASRLTATQPDFVRYYAKTKRDLNVPDGMLMIEFTESFAFDNYDDLKNIIDGLHKSGMKCSLDDFGQGHSSYRTLKELPIDEIKLDKMFLDKGYDTERDDKVIKSIIDLAKDLGIKVTQEGVEEQSEVDRMRRLGADVLQGYIYSKPISTSDYITFVQQTKEHKLD